MIEKNIHLIWYQGWKNFPYDKYGENIEQTKKLNPDWKIFYWDNDSIRAELKNLGQKYLDKYDSFKIMHQKIDYGRFAVLFSRGGISIDSDAKAVKSFNEIPYLNSSNLIVGYSNMDKISTAIHGYENRTINNSVILAKQYHPILREVLDYILNLDCGDKDDFSCVIFTGGQSFNEVLYKHKNEITILPNEYFEACHSSDSGCELPPEAIILHSHAQTWVPKNYQSFAKIYFFIKKNWLWIIFILIIFILIFLSRKK